jgi:hypothetical protein
MISKLTEKDKISLNNYEKQDKNFTYTILDYKYIYKHLYFPLNYIFFTYYYIFLL